MASITLQGNEIHTTGNLPEVGSVAQNFTLVAEDLSEKSLSDFVGKKVVLNIFPSIDTGVCAASARHFNADLNSLENTNKRKEVIILNKNNNKWEIELSN